MSYPGSARPDLCSIRAAAKQDERAEAVGGGFSDDGYPLGDVDPPASLISGIDLAIRLSTAVAVLAVAGIAAYVSYWHAYAVVRAYGQSGITARLEPATIDGLVYASSMFSRGPRHVARRRAGPLCGELLQHILRAWRSSLSLLRSPASADLPHARQPCGATAGS